MLSSYKVLMAYLRLVFLFSTTLPLILISCNHANSLVYPLTSASDITFLSEHSNITDRQVLVSFKSMMSSDPTGSLASWNGSIHFCNWLGVTCSGRRHPQRVISLNLSSLDLVGVISPSIANLTFLRMLDLSNNKFHGPIPLEIDQLHRLQHLNMSVNSLEGGIPAMPSLSTNLSSLSILSLYDNQLSGDIPPTLVCQAPHRALRALGRRHPRDAHFRIRVHARRTARQPVARPGRTAELRKQHVALAVPDPFGPKPLVIDTFRNKSYSARDMSEFLADIGYGEGVHPYRTRVMPMVNGLSDPGVNVTCIFGSGVDTPEVLVYGSGGFDVQPEVVYGDGDGTVNMASLLWLESEYPGVKVIKVPGMSHTSILKDDDAVKKIIGEINDINHAPLISPS